MCYFTFVAMTRVEKPWVWHLNLTWSTTEITFEQQMYTCISQKSISLYENKLYATILYCLVDKTHGNLLTSTTMYNEIFDMMYVTIKLHSFYLKNICKLIMHIVIVFYK